MPKCKENYRGYKVYKDCEFVKLVKLSELSDPSASQILDGKVKTRKWTGRKDKNNIPIAENDWVRAKAYVYPENIHGNSSFIEIEGEFKVIWDVINAMWVLKHTGLKALKLQCTQPICTEQFTMLPLKLVKKRNITVI